MKGLCLCLVVVMLLGACSQGNSIKSESNKQNEEACASLAKFAERTMRSRQANILMDVTFKEVDSNSNVPEDSKVLLKNIILDAYKQPVFTDQSFKDRQIADFTNDTHLKCLEVMK
ncbi:hypothetical protein B9T23_13855 [Acinetobacter terrae]|uniref:hypothetical protein n=1 Tax=Acinetobacter terrae TaxID=2731247 RepID=UPI000A32CBDF|nr:hypothetical protein [Acinetobacter terrae]OTG73430.1 hypothetical protein B9T23_13855 [Acinetobacter terrae]